MGVSWQPVAGGDMSVLDITRGDDIAARVGDKLKGRVAFVTGGTRGIGGRSAAASPVRGGAGRRLCRQ